jgi:FkbM family methyltransferase
MTLVDVGAFCGYYTLLFSHLTGPLGRVVAFEPHPTTFGYLARTVDRNGCSNVEIANVAAAAACGPVHLVLHRWPDHHWVAASDRVGHATIPVPAVSLDDFFRQGGWPRIDLVKIDVEGAEDSVLRGMADVSRRNPQLQLIMELDQPNLCRAGTGWAEVAGTLRALGFRSGRVIEQGLRPFTLSGPIPTATTCNVLITRD